MRTYHMIRFSDGATKQVTQRTYPKRHGYTVVDSWPANDPPPANGDARAWDAYRARQGYSGAHH